MSELGWLHLTDLHVSQPREAGRMPEVIGALERDLRDVVAGRRGADAVAIDVVFFTGDIAFKGAADEFARATAILQRVLRTLAEANTAHHGRDRAAALPLLVAVPGNHDLARPDPRTAADVRRIRDAVGADAHLGWDREPQLVDAIDAAFAQYTRWLNHPLPFARPEGVGELPGDARYVICRDGFRLAVVTLNSAWSHLGDPDDGALHLDHGQFTALVERPAEWRARHDAALLLTHHPPHSLGDVGRAHLSRIVGDAIDLHLYGHAHVGGHVADPGARGELHGLMGRSLFGAEEGGHARMHGYTVGRFVRAADRVRTELYTRKGWSDGQTWTFGPLLPERGRWRTSIELGAPAPARAVDDTLAAHMPDQRAVQGWDPIAAGAPTSDRARWLFLSASVPPARQGPGRRWEQPFADSTRADRVHATVLALAERLADSDTGIIFGGAPDITVFMAPALLADPGRKPWVVMAQATQFQDAFRDVIGALTTIDAVACLKANGLAEMRAGIAAFPGLVGSVYIGGRGGVVDEFVTLRAAHPDKPHLALGVGGGAAADLLLGGPISRAHKPDLRALGDLDAVSLAASGARAGGPAIGRPGRLWHSPQTAVDAIVECFGIEA